MTRELTTLLTYFRYTTHAGDIRDDNSTFVTRHTVGRIENTDQLILSIGWAKGTCQQARFKAAGSSALIGGAQFLCEHIEGKCFSQLLKLTDTVILEHLKLPMSKRHIAVMLIQALHNSIEEAQINRG